MNRLAQPVCLPAWLDKKKREWDVLTYLWPNRGFSWKIKNIINFVDDPIDDLKHTLHGIEFRGKKYYLPKWLMRGSGDSTK